MAAEEPVAAAPPLDDIAAALALPKQPRPTNDLIAEALTDEPQTSEMVYQTMVTLAAGAYLVPTLNTVQSALSSRGDKIGKRVNQGKRTQWVKYGEGESYSASASKAAAKKAAGKRKLTPSKRKELEAAAKAAKKVKTEKKVDFGALRRKAEGYIAKPMSAFVLFGLSQLLLETVL